jgi:hypothetical protein
MMQHPETVYRLAEHRLAEYREVGAAERLAGTVKSRPYNVVDYLSAGLEYLSGRLTAWRTGGRRSPRRWPRNASRPRRPRACYEL